MAQVLVSKSPVNSQNQMAHVGLRDENITMGKSTGVFVEIFSHSALLCFRFWLWIRDYPQSIFMGGLWISWTNETIWTVSYTSVVCVVVVILNVIFMAFATQPSNLGSQVFFSEFCFWFAGRLFIFEHLRLDYGRSEWVQRSVAIVVSESWHKNGHLHSVFARSEVKPSFNLTWSSQQHCQISKRPFRSILVRPLDP